MTGGGVCGGRGGGAPGGYLRASWGPILVPAQQKDSRTQAYLDGKVHGRGGHLVLPPLRVAADEALLQLHAGHHGVQADDVVHGGVVLARLHVQHAIQARHNREVAPCGQRLDTSLLESDARPFECGRAHRRCERGLPQGASLPAHGNAQLRRGHLRVPACLAWQCSIETRTTCGSQWQGAAARHPPSPGRSCLSCTSCSFTDASPAL